MYIKRIVILIVALGLIFMGSFSLYVYKVMFNSNTSFDEKSKDLYIKTGTSYNQLLNQLDSYVLNVDDFDVLAKRKKYNVRPGKYQIKNGMNNNDIINSLRSNNITVNVIYNNIVDLNDLAGKISNQIEADSISFLNSFKTEFFKERGFDEKNILSMYI
ncbi:MAG: endolytic transglycosylase MltG, partial [Flavobacteriaceae bacterium]|nr:endolytic transglycosylase MltG [Flavobacteriaceae bacterium]